MSKRFYHPQQQGNRKKAKLDFTISDQNFLLSQNDEKNNDDNQADNWGDDNDDELLLLASQACEQACSGNISTLPDYSICMQPSSTSTQNYIPGPSTSKNPFTFKKPTTNASNIVSTNLKNKCEVMSSPLPGISEEIQKTNLKNLAEDIFHDRIYKGDTDHVHRQLLQMQEEITKLKSEKGKLLEKCVTKDGEVSILRTQLKTSQVAADNARLEKIKFQERLQMEWTEKLAAANNQLQELRTQLDFKNLEITSIKEKCKMIESSKVKLTQVNLSKNDFSSSYKGNNSIALHNELKSPLLNRIKRSSKTVQTESHTSHRILKLNIAYRNKPKKLSQILPLTMEPTLEQHSILEYNEKLQRPMGSIPNRFKVFSTFHRIASTPKCPRMTNRSKITLNDIYEDLTSIASDKGREELHKRTINILEATKTVLNEVILQLEMLAKRTTTAFHREMDMKYIESTSNLLIVNEKDLLCGRPLYKEEQAITARRMVAVFYYILEYYEGETFILSTEQENNLLETINKICLFLDKTSCAILYSGLLQAISMLLDKVLSHSQGKSDIILKVIKTIIESRPMLFVACEVLRPLRKLALTDQASFCEGGSAGNLKLDHDQGVLLFNKDSCFLQVLLKQIEAAVMCIQKQKLEEFASVLCQDLILFYSDLNLPHDSSDGPSCECRQTFLQTIVYALRTCAVMLNCDDVMTERRAELLGACRSGLQTLYRLCRDLDLGLTLGFGEGYLIEFCEIMRAYPHDDLYSYMLSEVTSTFQTSPEECPSIHREPWIKSFQNFFITD
ncbi:ATR-interacting protein mus304-like [Battus philenor]|uniref:ATR-interacting protein mus304-like n=1 Tax=Battus philenor TaxID=42288 RepID=UPI0035CE94F7